MLEHVCSNKRSELKGTNGEIPSVSWEKQKEEPCNAKQEADNDRAFLITKTGLNWVCLTQSLPLAMLGQWMLEETRKNNKQNQEIENPVAIEESWDSQMLCPEGLI